MSAKSNIPKRKQTKGETKPSSSQNKRFDATSQSIKSIIQIFKTEGQDIDELEFENKEFKIRLKKLGEVITASPRQREVSIEVPPPSSNISEQKEKAQPQEEKVTTNNLFVIKSPMVGTFYSKPSPDKKPFIEKDSIIKKGQTIAVLEAMKLFNELESEIDGRIVEILATDGDPVEFDQPLFKVEQH